MVGGTAGCVVAGRLATADPDLRILVLEAGPTTHNDPAHMHPALFLSHIMPGSRTVRGHESRPSAALGGRSTIVQTGQCLGGGGSVNCAFLPPPSLHFPIFSDREIKGVMMMTADVEARMNGRQMPLSVLLL